jgi:ElaB/YqjD/DUF883 family membrane-anchored ribosome-binding protein
MRDVISDAKDRLSEPLEDLKGVLNDAVDRAGKQARQTARQVARRGAEAAEEFRGDAERKIRKYPMESIGVAFGAGLLIGAALFFLIRHDD